ncbi:polysaccharide pyruvyl transferase family protein [Thalassotalea agarivorans]|uniref:Polysaccharide pyruvyl transferase n=1 Tax=Thalassotalea agarivorans TaxID=349064 RepID=A0A1H9YKV8_THASX|nr:polysaccharide pyruvyl transferase family protein [Thalassotalea agarivorans]SES69236.1 Polysaccharide pyruvyl transferase [Thalassotalea agarivorans]
MNKLIRSIGLKLKLIEKEKLPVLWFSRVVNLGDVLNVYLVEKISDENVIPFDPQTFQEKNYFVIGSVLSQANTHSIVWGSGYMFASGGLKAAPAKICAVRGPKTRDRLLREKIDCPEIYGDPALLLPKFYQPKQTKQYKLGVIPHYVDKNSPWVENLSKNAAVNIIDIQTDDVEKFVDELAKCERIVSSSLHGVIIADAYDIPSLWVELSNKVAGNGFKFEDYFMSVGRDKEKSKLDINISNLDEIIDSFYDYKIDIDLDKLLNACPFG